VVHPSVLLAALPPKSAFLSPKSFSSAVCSLSKAYLLVHFRLVLELRRFLGCALELFKFFDVARRQHKVVFRDRGGSLVLRCSRSTVDKVSPVEK